MGKIVGILSMQRVINYGSFLQAYALKQLLLKNGAKEVYFIDNDYGKISSVYHHSFKNLSNVHLVKSIPTCFTYKTNITTNYNFIKFMGEA